MTEPRRELARRALGPDLDSLPLDCDIGSREAVSVDYAARIRLQYLAEQTATLVRQTQFADAKASAVLALAGLVAARVAIDVHQMTLGPLEIGLFASKGLVLALCLLVLIPRYPGGPQRRAALAQERFSWVALSAPGYEPDDYAEFARTAQISQLVVSMARSNVHVSRVLLRKFRYLRAAFQFAILDVCLTLAYYLGAFDALTRTAAAP